MAESAPEKSAVNRRIDLIHHQLRHMPTDCTLTWQVICDRKIMDRKMNRRKLLRLIFLSHASCSGWHATKAHRFETAIALPAGDCLHTFS